MRDEKPIQFIECKWSDSSVSDSLRYLKERYPACEAWQISAIGKKDFMGSNNIRVCPATVF
ncbi:MAG: hypothetical protein A3E84_02940 [Gammaproteobacteria bacterium RIFCSPHIGHO2_12_FULL_42_13]|nr:MAG: hypothetical protein A3E84_02940 [Gammaproteobacteria bacterium RIFCSPHIGHO2_12_FULL_42_13]